MGLGNSKKTLAYDDLKEKIINNVLQPGQIVNEIELSNELHTSKTPVREALQQLEKEGFIENIHGKGFFISRISIQDLKELFDIRKILECEVARRAALTADPKMIEAARKEFEASEWHVDHSVKEGYFRAGDRVHTLIFEIYGNAILTDLYRRLQERIIRTQVYLSKNFDNNRVSSSYQEHIEILDSLAAKDPERAAAAIKTHLDNSLDFQWASMKSGT